MVGDAARARLGGVVRVVSHEGVPRGFHLLAVPSPRGEEFDEDRLPLDGGIVAAGGDTVRRTVSRFHERARARAFILAGKGGTHLSSVSSVAEAEARARARIIFIIGRNRYFVGEAQKAETLASTRLVKEAGFTDTSWQTNRYFKRSRIAMAT